MKQKKTLIAPVMGAPPVRQIAKLNVAASARRHTEKAIQRLAEALDDSDVKVRMDAAVRLLDRGHGKPTQTIERGDKSPDLMDDVELLNAIREAALGDMGETGTDSKLTH
jgi:hypothetical protein